MPVVNFAEWVAPDLTLQIRGHRYQMAPPTVEHAKRMLVVCTITLGADLSAELKQLAEDLAETPTRLAILGQDLCRRMESDQVPKTDQDRLAIYASWYWTQGRSKADQIADLLWGQPAQAGSADEVDPKAANPTPPKTGTPTGSAKKTRSPASTPTTAKAPASSSPTRAKATKAKPATSRQAGRKSSPTGRSSQPNS